MNINDGNNEKWKINVIIINVGKMKTHFVK